jgi:hypothetical protein
MSKKAADIIHFVGAMDKYIKLNHPGYDGNDYNFLLKHAQVFEKAVLADVLGEKKQCYANSFRMVAGECSDRLVYCEGFANSIIPIEHAWVYDRSAEAVIETTWDKPANCYFGVGFDRVWLTAHILKKRTFGVLFDFSCTCPFVSGKEEYEPIELEGGQYALLGS